MKTGKIIAVLAALLMLVMCFTSCGDKNPSAASENGSVSWDGSDENSSAGSADSESTTYNATANNTVTYSSGMVEEFDELEYSKYYNFFYNGDTADAGQTVTKKGTFAAIKTCSALDSTGSSYNPVTRYYVWGYLDRTKCCDYQWEFVLPEGTEAPKPGSHITVTGKMTQDSAALDGYWLTDCTVTVDSPFDPAAFDWDMTTLSATLERVLIAYMQYYPEEYTGDTVRIFCRSMGANTVQHPYYNDSWQLDFVNGDKVVPVDNWMLLDGSLEADDGPVYVSATGITDLDA